MQEQAVRATGRDGGEAPFSLEKGQGGAWREKEGRAPTADIGELGWW